MALLDNVNDKIVVDPPRLVIYGKPKVGKSTIVSQAEKPLTICFEDGIKNIKTNSYLVKDYTEFKKLIQELIDLEHEYKTLNLDSLTFLEKMMHEYICAENNASSISKVGGGFGNGYIVASEEMYKLLGKLDELCRKKRMTINILGHQVVAEDVNSMGDDYKISRFEGNKHIVPLLERWADGILCMSEKVYTKTEEKGFGESTTKAVAKEDVVLICGGAPGVLAKSRYDLPNEIPVTKENGWNDLMENIKKGI